ncbi:MAG: SLBB domain-containing protein [Deltaproteobacteria bacterium]|nr:SLBB domain-containing protein [Deltaproteobacteria bacterium]
MKFKSSWINRFLASLVLVSFLFSVGVSDVLAQTKIPTESGGGADAASGLSFREKSIPPPPSPFLHGGGTAGVPQISSPMGGGMGAPPVLFYQVHVLGEVTYPGTYRVMASTRMAELVGMAGGVTPLGSDRRVELRHEKQQKTYDLLQFKISADLSQNPYVQDNDIIFVPLKRKTIRIVGAVKRPGEYEMVRETSIDDVVRLAGGFTVGFLVEDGIHIIRFEGSQRQVIKLEPSSSDWKKFDIQGGDVIYIPNVITKKNRFDFGLPKLPGDNIFYPSFEDRVFVVGAVNEAGAYPFNPYYTISQYLSLAAGKTLMAKRKLYVVSPDGKRVKVKKGKEEGIVINPGDTIIVPEKRFDSEGWLSLFMTITNFTTSMIFTIVALSRL